MFNENTRVREIMHLPGILAIVEKYTKHKMNMATLKMGANFTIRMVGNYLKWTPAQMQEVLRELNNVASSTGAKSAANSAETKTSSTKPATTNKNRR